MNKNTKVFPRFLDYNTARITLKSEYVHENTTDELVLLRNALSALDKIISLKSEHLSGMFWVDLSNVDFHKDIRTLYTNQNLIPIIVSQLNVIIGRRNLTVAQERMQKIKEKKTNESKA